MSLGHDNEEEPLSQGEPAGQDALFPESDVLPIDPALGFRGPVACKAAGITYRQLDYWARTELVEASIRRAEGSGTQRLYSFRDILMLRIVKRLLDTGVSLTNVRAAVRHLADRGVTDLTQITLMSDGSSIYECRSDEEVIDLLRGGQGVFGIAVGQVFRDVEGSLLHLPAVDGAGQAVVPDTVDDELAKRRARKIG